MTNDKTRQEGPPAADPIRQETGGQEPPAADQASTEPAKKRGRPKKKKIIVVEGSKDQLTAASLLTEDQAAAEGQRPDGITLETPEEWQNMTPHELVEYAREHPEEWHKAVSSLQETFENMQSRLNSSVSDAIRAGLKLGLSDQLTDSLAGDLKRIAEKIGMADYGIKTNVIARRVKEIEIDLTKIIQAISKATYLADLPDNAEAEALDAIFTEIDEELRPFIDDILKADPTRKGMNTDDLLDTLPGYAYYYLLDDQETGESTEAAEGEGWTGIGRPPADMMTDDIAAFLKIIQKARAAREAEKAEAEREQLPQIQYKNGTDVKTVTDKFANLFFSLSAPQSRGAIDGQRQFIPVRYEKQGAKKEITLLYDYSFNEDIISRFGLSKSFDDQSFFVASIVDNLLDEGNNTVSLTKIWHELGNSGSPNADALTNLVNILRLGMSTIITADISQVNEAWNVEKDGVTRELISPVIPVQIAQEKFAANGKTANAVINITGHTPFYIIGYPLDHFTTWSKDVLRLYKGRRTKRYYSVLRFLITQIGWMRNGKSKRGNKILYESLYSYTGDKTTRARQLSRDMMYRLFDEVFIPTGYISGYKEVTSGKPGVKLTYKKTPQITEKK